MRGFIEGVSRGFSKLVEPFVSESIWLQATQDLIARAGRTKEGKRLWNPEEPEGDKAWKGLKHLVEAVAPFSYPQLKRLYIAKMFGRDPETGREYSFSGEAAGFLGFRNVKMDIPESMSYKITDYNTALRNSRAFLPRPRGEVDPADILKGYIDGNRAWFRNMQKMKKSVENMKALGYSDRDIFEIFERRNQKKDFEYLNKGVFKPFDLPKGLIEEYIRNAEDKGYVNPMTKDLWLEIKQIQKELNGLSLEGDYPEIGEPAAPVFDPTRTGQIETPQVNPELVQKPMSMDMNVMNTGLTPTEQALLSNEEKAIRLRQRGIG
jgi:hypothetical protein